MRAALRYFQSACDWRRAANEAGNLSVLYMHWGKLRQSEDCARLAVDCATRSGDRTLLSARLATLGDPLVQMGPPMRKQAQAAFEAAEAIQKEVDPEHPLLYSTKGYRYHWFLLDVGKDDEVLWRTRRTANWSAPGYGLLDRGLNRLIRGRAYMSRANRTLAVADWQLATHWIHRASDTLQEASYQEAIVLALLAQAELQARDKTPTRLVESSLNAAWEIASRGPMPLFQADIYL